MKRNHTIAKAEAARDAAEKKFRATVKAQQAKCDHPIVLARPSGNPYRYIEVHHQEYRVCPACGLGEEGHYGTFKKLKTEAVVMKDHGYPIYNDRILVDG